MSSQTRLASGQPLPFDTMTLFCWVFGDGNPFPVDISPEKTVGHLKEAIVAKDPDRFQGIGAYKLKLYKKIIPSEEKENLQLSELEKEALLNETWEISEYFETDPPKKYIHIVIKTPGQLTERQLLMLCPHLLTYTPDSQRKKSKTTTKLNWARTPASVVGWQDFIHKASIMALNDTTPQYDKPTFMPYEVSEEEEVREALNVNVLRVLSATVGSSRMPGEVFRRCSAFEKVQGKPDFILVDDNRLILAIEVKTKWALSVDDIVEMYQDNLEDLTERRASPVSVIDPIKQIYGYMGHNKLQYGVLSTYERTWFLRRPQDNPGELFISEVVMNTATNPTLLQCLVYIMSLARHNPNSSSPPASPSPPVGDYEPPDEKDDGDSTYHPPKGSSSRSGRGGQGRNRGSTGKRGGSSNTGKRDQSNIKGGQRAAGNEQSNGVLRLEDFGWDSFDVIDVLGNGRCGTVFKAVLRGEKVAFKLCDLWQYPEYEKEMLTEVKTYMSLEQLQGRTVPKLKGAGYTAGGFFAIATEIAGSPIEVEELSDQERNETVKALSNIHDHGILHKDICPENILIQRHRYGFKVVFIDFAFSERVSNKEEPKKEMAILKMMLGLCPIIKNGKFKKPRLA